MADRREACSTWPPADSCLRCGGFGGWYKAVGPRDWDWTTCQECNGTGAHNGRTIAGEVER